MRRIASSALAVLLVVAVAACGGAAPKSGPQAAAAAPKALQAGQCVAGEMADGKDVVPDPKTVVPCTKPHVYEIVAVVDVPKQFLVGETDAEKLARRSAFADVDDDAPSSIRAKMSEATFSKCAAPFRKATGMAGLKVNGKSAADVSLYPSLKDVSEWYTVSSPEQWVAGITQAVCSYRFAAEKPGLKGNPPPTLVSSRSARPVISSYLHQDYPASLRWCFVAGGGHEMSCAKRHGMELLWSMDMKAVYGREFASGADLKNLAGEDLAKIESACGAPYASLGHRTGPSQFFNFRFSPKQGTTKRYLTITCVLAARDGSSLGPGFESF
jgi:hypothetical protein